MNGEDADRAGSLSALPPLREVVDGFGLLAKRSLGQNFLLDMNLTAKIARAAGDLTGKNVIEIGPGPGGLTRALLEAGAASVHAIERDDRCVAALQELVTAAEGRLVLHADDALKVDYAALCPAPRAIVANLPYNIGTVLLIGWLKNLTLFDSMTLMFQKEVAERIAARVDTSAYGRLSVMAQWLCQVEKKFDIPRQAFTPPPKITSTVIRLRPRTDRSESVAFDVMERLVAAAFGQRRKMLRQSLKTLEVDSNRIFELSGVDPTARAEQIDVAGFLRMAQALEQQL